MHASYFRLVVISKETVQANLLWLCPRKKITLLSLNFPLRIVRPDILCLRASGKMTTEVKLVRTRLSVVVLSYSFVYSGTYQFLVTSPASFILNIVLKNAEGHFTEVCK